MPAASVFVTGAVVGAAAAVVAMGGFTVAVAVAVTVAVAEVGVTATTAEVGAVAVVAAVVGFPVFAAGDGAVVALKFAAGGGDGAVDAFLATTPTVGEAAAVGA